MTNVTDPKTSQNPNEINKMYDSPGFLEEFQGESDRAAAVLGGVLIDRHLRNFIAQFLIDDEKEVDLLLGSDEFLDRPLTNFSARRRAAYCLGLITKDQYHDLKMIEKVRNYFAHHLHGLSFADEQIKGWCNSLKTPKRLLPDAALSPRDAFLIAVYSLATSFRLKAISINKKGERRIVPIEPKITRKEFK
jgi:DNA-binding MltR family transcriptional regulator